MSCEDCKNYEKKDKTDFKDTGKKVNDLLQGYCDECVCEECGMHSKEEGCQHEEIKNLLRQAGVEV